MHERLLLNLPHRQFVWTVLRILRPYFRHNRRLFSEISRLIFAIIKGAAQAFYSKAANTGIKTGMVLAYQTSGEFLRAGRPHGIPISTASCWKADLMRMAGSCISLSGTSGRMSEYFRRVIIKFFLKKELISAKIATSLINWRHSGFSVDYSIHLPAHSTKARKALSQYISRPPLSLKKISVCENGDATVISYTSDNEFFQGKTEPFSVSRFLLEVTQHIPPRGSQYSGNMGSMRPEPREYGRICRM